MTDETPFNRCGPYPMYARTRSRDNTAAVNDARREWVRAERAGLTVERLAAQKRKASTPPPDFDFSATPHTFLGYIEYSLMALMQLVGYAFCACICIALAVAAFGVLVFLLALGPLGWAVLFVLVFLACTVSY